MPDANDLLETIKRTASGANDASKPVALMYGKVTSVSPIEVNVEQKMILHSAQLVLTRNVSDYETEATVDWDTEATSLSANHSHDVTGNVTVNSQATVSPNPDNVNVNISNEVSHDIGVSQKNINLTHGHSISGRKSITIHNGLAVGDEVLLLRMQGGQKYIVIDKVV